jgi:DNA polymerase III delta prime subunit
VTVTIPAPITTTCSLVGLDTQFREIQDWVQAKRKQTLLPDAEKDKKFRHCIAISGPPGTGKSALVDQVITSMQFKSVCKFTVGSTISISLAEELKAALIRQPLQAILNPTVGSSLHNHARDTAIVIEELDAIVEIGSRASKVNVDDPSDPLILGKLIDVLNKIPSHQTPPIFITYQDMTSQKHKPYKTFIGTKCKKVDLKPYTEATLERIGREVTKKHGWSNIIPSVFLKQMAQMANGDARKMISVVQELGYFHTA